MMRTMIASLGVLLLSGVPGLRAADKPLEPQVFRSGPGRVPLLELYTSEGCSSSPAGDRWFSSLTEKKGLWKDFVPVAFHVDYWDYLGWPDRFASEANSNRQRAHARVWKNPQGVYTPGVVYGGEEWRRWRVWGKLPRSSEKPGVLRAELRADRRLRIAFEPASGEKGPWVVEAALLGFGISTEVRAGENAGERLRHDFSALASARAALNVSGGLFEAELDLPSSGEKAAGYGLAVWVSRSGSPEAVQAVGGYLKGFGRQR